MICISYISVSRFDCIGYGSCIYFCISFATAGYFSTFSSQFFSIKISFSVHEISKLSTIPDTVVLPFMGFSDLKLIPLIFVMVKLELPLLLTSSRKGMVIFTEILVYSMYILFFFLSLRLVINCSRHVLLKSIY